MLGFVAFEPACLRVVACFWGLGALLAALWRAVHACGWLAFLKRLNRLISRRVLTMLRFMVYRDKPQVSSTIGNTSTMMDSCSSNVSLAAGSSSGAVLGGVCRAFVVSGVVSVLRVW